MLSYEFNTMRTIFTVICKIVLLSLFSLLYIEYVKANNNKINKNSIATIPEKVNVIQTDNSTKKLNIEISDYSIFKSKLNHKFVENVKPWSALNNNVVCNLIFEFNIPKNDLELKKVSKPFCKTSAALLKLNNQSIIDIKNHKLYYYQNEEWIKCNRLSKLTVKDKMIKVKVQIPIMNSELQKLKSLNTSSIDKVRILFNNNEKYIDWVINEDTRVLLFDKLKKISDIDNNEMKTKLVTAKQRRGF